MDSFSSAFSLILLWIYNSCFKSLIIPTPGPNQFLLTAFFFFFNLEYGSHLTLHVLEFFNIF